MISLLITALVFALFCYLLFWILGYLGTPDPIRKIVTVIVVVIACIWLISLLGHGVSGVYHTPWAR